MDRSNSNNNKTVANPNEPSCSSSTEYISLQTDWDLDAAFSSSSQPYLSLNIELVTPLTTHASSPLPPPHPASLAHKPSSSTIMSDDRNNNNNNQHQHPIDSISDEWEVINSSLPTPSPSPSSSSPPPPPPSTSSSSPVPPDTTSSPCSSQTTSRSGSLNGGQISPHLENPNNNSNDIKSPIHKPKSTVINRCVSVIHKVFNNLARSNSASL